MKRLFFITRHSASQYSKSIMGLTNTPQKSPAPPPHFTQNSDPTQDKWGMCERGFIVIELGRIYYFYC